MNMVQPLFAFADLGFFLLRLFIGVFVFEDGWKIMQELRRGGRLSFLSGILPGFAMILGALLLIGGLVQLAAIAALALLLASREVREKLRFPDRAMGLLAVALVVLAFAGGGLLGADQLFGFIVY